MLKENIATLYRLLGCNNAKIAQAAGYAPSEISRLRSGARRYGPASRPVLRFAQGVYLYADSVGAVKPLAVLCGAGGQSREEVVPALAGWLFGKSSSEAPAFLPMVEESMRTAREKKRRFFGEKLGEAMDALDLTNLRLARQINVDASTVSRFRSGLRSPKPPMDRLLAAALLERARAQDLTHKLARLCGAGEEELDLKVLSAWLYESDGDMLSYSFSHIDDLLDSIERFQAESQPALPDPAGFVTPEVRESGKTTYWGTEGLREAVIRFLAAAAEKGGELLLYSDQDMEWMVGDPVFRGRWAALMAACVRAGVQMRVIHNTDRDVSEMLSAIQSWMPLYMSGMIKPYVCQLEPDSRFSKTLFLRPEGECILASRLRGKEDGGWYEYVTEERKLKAAGAQFAGLLAGSVPLVDIFFDSDAVPFETDQGEGTVQLLLSNLSLATLPRDTLRSILDRSGAEGDLRARLERAHSLRSHWLKKRLARGKVREFVTLPSEELLFQGRVGVDAAGPLRGGELRYTPEEYAAHAGAVLSLLREDPNYELVILPEQPFAQIQILAAGSRVTVTRTGKPRVDFLFSEGRMVRAFGAYFTMLDRQYRTDREDTGGKLLRFL